MKRKLTRMSRLITGILIFFLVLAPISVEAAAKLSKPANFKGSVKITQEYLTELTVTWGKVKGAEGYQVYYRDTSPTAEGGWESWVLLNKTKKTTATASIIDGKFQVRVRAYKGTSYSKFTKNITVLGGKGIVQSSKLPGYETSDTLVDNTYQDPLNENTITSFAIDTFDNELNADGTELTYTSNGWKAAEGRVKAYATLNNGSQAIIETTVEGPGSLSFIHGLGMEIDAPDMDDAYEKSLNGVSKMQFYIDDQLSDLNSVFEIGVAGETQYRGHITFGTHKLKWVYSYSGGADDPYLSYYFLSDLEFTQDEIYKITFNGNGNGDENYEVTTSENEKISMKTPIREGYSFVEWNSSANGSGNTYNSKSEIGGSFVLYAIWKKKPVIKLSSSSLQIYKSQSGNLTLNNAEEKVTWKSSNTKVATVSSAGKVTGVSAGKATITATTGGVDYACKVTVNKVTAKALYNQLLETGVYTYDYFEYKMKMNLSYFYYMDLNKDGVKELIVSDKDKAEQEDWGYTYKATALVFTVKDSKLVFLGYIMSCIDEKGLMYNKKYKGIITEPDSGTGGRGNGYGIYNLVKNKLKSVNECYWYYETLPYKNNYSINNKNTTKSKYNAFVKKYFKQSDYTHLSMHSNTKANRSKYIK